MASDAELTLGQASRSVVRGLFGRLKSNYDFIYERLGDEGIELIRDMSWKYGSGIAERAKQRMEKNDLISVAKHLMGMFDAMGLAGGFNISYEVPEMSENRVVLRAWECPMGIDNYKICIAHTHMEKAVVEGLNPNLTYRIGKSIPAGDPYCEHIIDVRKQG